jgi:penicillin amidase
VALATFSDELGDTAEVMLDDLYYWQERLQALLVEGESPWFDDVGTPEVETRDELVRRAATPLRQHLEPLVGADPSSWRWGDLHHLTFVHPLVRTGVLGRWLGSGPHGMGGSAETLYRGWYDFGEPFGITHCASLRMVADLSDDEKIRAILPGGVAGRAFHPHQKDQVEAFVSGEVRHWWFSDGAIRREARSTLRLVP